MDTIEKLRRRVLLLESALIWFGRHEDDCPYLTGECNCGYMNIMRGGTADTPESIIPVAQDENGGLHIKVSDLAGKYVRLDDMLFQGSTNELPIAVQATIASEEEREASNG